MPELFAFIPIVIVPIAWLVGIWTVAILLWFFGALLLVIGWILRVVGWVALAILQLSHFLAIISTAIMILTYFYGLISRRNNIGAGVFSVMSDYGFSHSALMSLISKQRQNDVNVKENRLFGRVYVLFFIDFLILAFAFDFDYLAKFNYIIESFWDLKFWQ